MASALAKIREGLAELAAADTAEEHDGDLGAAVVDVGQAASQLAAQEARLLRAFDERGGYRADACVSAKGWLRLKTALGPGAIKRRVERAGVLARMPALREAFEAGAVRAEHVDAVAYRAVPSRIDAIAEHDVTLTRLASTAEPKHVAAAVQTIVDQVDRDGSDDPTPCETDDLRNLSLHDGYSGLENLDGSVTPLLGEVLRQVNTVYGRPDPADTPVRQRRSAGQRFHDAVLAALTVALDHHPGATIDGVKTHIGVFVDLFTIMGADELATIKPRLASGKGITPDLARHIIATTNPTMRAIVGLGPWRPVSVGRVRRMPPWLEMASYLGHPHCRGPGCDLPAWLCDDDHIDPYCQGGITALINLTPLCHPHNDLKHNEGWTVAFNTDTGEVTWTSADHTKIITLPPPDI